MHIIITLLVSLGAVSAVPSISQRIVGGSLTTIDKYPSMAAILISVNLDSTYQQGCGGTILNDKSILTAAHCTLDQNLKRFKIRVGSSYASSGGEVHEIGKIIVHPNYDPKTHDYDIAILQTVTSIQFNNVVKPVSIPGADYKVADNEKVWAAGWGATSYKGAVSEQLRDVQIMIINHDICRKRYKSVNITDNMVCSGLLDIGGRDQCQNDSGGPLYHNNNQIGVSSFGVKCATARHPGVSTYVPRFANWIKSNQ